MLEAVKLEMENTKARKLEYQKRQQTRTEFSVVIGYSDSNDPIQAFEADLIKALCFEYQGVSVLRGTGYWLTDDQFEMAYDPEIEPLMNPAREMNITINLNVTKDLAEDAYKLIKTQIEFHKEFYDMNIDWVHCTSQTVQARHFQV